MRHAGAMAPDRACHRITVVAVLTPTGPEPRDVYLRRRVAVVGAAVVVLLAVVWLATATAGDDPDLPAQAAATGSMTTSAPAPSSSAAAPTTTAAASSSSSAPAASSASSAPGTSSTAPSSPAPSSPASSVARGVACSDGSIDVAAQVGAPSYPVGAQPVFRLLITNTGKTPCSADLSARLQQVVVYSADGAKRVWSSNDCHPGTAADVRTLGAGEQAVYSIQWSGTSSTEGCATPRVPAAAGQYLVLTTLGALQSQPAPFTLI